MGGRDKGPDEGGAPAHRMDVDGEVEAATLGADRDGGERGVLVAAVPVPQDRCLAPGGPGAPDVGDEQEAGLVEEDPVRIQAPCVFLMAV